MDAVKPEVTLYFNMANIQLDDLTVNNLGVLKRINEAVLPISYQDSWYQDSLKVGELAKLAYFNDLPVGAIRCSLETPQNHNSPTRIYIMTLGVLEPYRRYGIATKLVNHVVEEAKGMYVHEILVHVWADNQAAIEWYTKRGFEKGDLVKGYYKKLPGDGDAYLMSLKF